VKVCHLTAFFVVDRAQTRSSQAIRQMCQFITFGVARRLGSKPVPWRPRANAPWASAPIKLVQSSDAPVEMVAARPWLALVEENRAYLEAAVANRSAVPRMVCR
jgi:hypothetical protein